MQQICPRLSSCWLLLGIDSTGLGSKQASRRIPEEAEQVHDPESSTRTLEAFSLLLDKRSMSRLENTDAPLIQRTWQVGKVTVGIQVHWLFSLCFISFSNTELDKIGKIAAGIPSMFISFVLPQS